MNILDHFSIPYKGLGIGLHQFKFEVDDSFFAAFEDAVIQNGTFQVTLDLDKRSDHSIMDFQVQGHTGTSCDRCLADISLPVEGQYTLHLKFSEEVSEDDEIVFVHPDVSIVNVAKYVYDVIGVSLPMTKVYDCENDPESNCNEKVLSLLNDDSQEEVSNDPKPSPWDQLKGLNFDK